MRVTTSLTTLLLLAFAATHTASASSSPRAEEEHKFIKRSLRGHGGGSGWGKTIAGGTALAATGAFAATGGSIAAHHLFDSHGERDSRRSEGYSEGRRGGNAAEGANVYTQRPIFQQTSSGGGVGNVEAPFPIGILMSNGATVPVPQKLLQSAFAQQQDQSAFAQQQDQSAFAQQQDQSAFAQQQAQSTGGGGVVFPQN
ncbi:hypothetical protein NDA18_004124 [Ustilago nuda]|nr:hypothetical protein NDA18_004124 [Ustilago nuda]